LTENQAATRNRRTYAPGGGNPKKEQCNDAFLMYGFEGVDYVEVACKGDTKTFVSSGFVAASARKRTPAQPISIPAIIKVDQGNPKNGMLETRPAQFRHN